MELSICHLYPEVFSGDRGNILCLQRRLNWRGIEVNVTRLSAGESARLSQFDLIYLGGGSDAVGGAPASAGAELRAAIEDGKTFLAIDGAYEFLGRVGALNIHTVDGGERLTGDLMFDAGEELGVMIGFENHSGRTALGPGVAPLGKVLYGHGNNGADGAEGCRYQNVFGTYAHGPILPKNPKLADYMLTAALFMKYPGVSLAPLDDTLENAAHDYMAARLRARG
ncbi:MAG: glutamine amidotransferase [Firmicutes bacterium]|nr:glutamine amidotransferase [Bacillota bacterium]